MISRWFYLTGLAVFVSCAALTKAQEAPATVHIVSARLESRQEVVAQGQMKGFMDMRFQFTLYTAKTGNVVYGLESADIRRPQVGKDYEVRQATATKMVLMIPGKKHADSITFSIRSVSEVEK
jgi:hypothetical protein